MNSISILPVVYENLVILVFAITRISFLFSTFILFRRTYVNRKVITSLTFILAYFAMLTTDHSAYRGQTFSSLMLSDLLIEAFIGFVSGFVMNIIFDVFTAAGQIISSQIGLSMISLIDPGLGSVTPLTMIYNYVAIVIFMTLNGHLLVIKLLMDSFNIIPIGTQVLPLEFLHDIIIYTRTIYASGISLSLAVIITMLLTNLTIAMMSRYAPQFNIFTVGINITLVGGLLFVYMMFNNYASSSEHIFNDGLNFLQQLYSRMM